MTSWLFGKAASNDSTYSPPVSESNWLTAWLKAATNKSHKRMWNVDRTGLRKGLEVPKKPWKRQQKNQKYIQDGNGKAGRTSEASGGLKKVSN